MSKNEPDGVIRFYRRSLETLTVASRCYRELTQKSNSEFLGMTRDEFDIALEEQRNEIDAQVVMMLVASAEGILRRDYQNYLRRGRKRSNALARSFKELDEAHGKRVRLEDILTAWKALTSQVQRIGRFNQLLKHRHWLAHGRYWTDKSGISTDPYSAYVVINDVFAAFQSARSDFPKFD